CMQALEFPWSF
nr:immunoglobulin light chain junction region [Macaca mulatta]MOX98364.1 immunoglobulin light chain junction region [Macaca mulatta]MOX98515.1 immunoglobulin light chain junction region [Macaca mulatta]MOX99066.1 immunoglobulin light chain junction region [Macaca mulatta]MOX99661.1 immunoglobulin light chain junction region [Macaca mulatta]